MGQASNIIAALSRLKRAWDLSASPDGTPGAVANYLVSVDDWGGATVRGWVVDKRYRNRPVPICLVHRGTRIWSGVADRFRSDLKDVGLSGGHSGFEAPRPPLVVDFVGGVPEHLALCVDKPGLPCLAAIDLTAALGDFRTTYERLFADTTNCEPIPHQRRTASPLIERLYAPTAPDATGAAPTTRPSAYSTFLRQTRLPADVAERTGPGSPPDRLLASLLRYGRTEPVEPIPFSAAEIAWMNESVFLGDSPYPLSRATTYFLAEPDPHRPPLDLTRADSHEALVAWWVLEKLPGLKAADCLIPDSYRRLLMRDVRPGAHPRFSLPAIMRHLWRDDPLWSSLLGIPEATLPLLHARALLAALERPFLLDFLPPAERDHLLDLWEAETKPGAACPFPGRAQIEARFNRHGVSLAESRTRQLSREGHRGRVFALPVPTDEPVDCQLIGPLDRASGLGQSARLMLEGLATLPIRVNGYAFTTGNPQPLAAGVTSPANTLRPARTQIFHLNPDQLPLALSQLPDMFDSARKIGVFYWELDKPAPGDRLALDLVDEIWVATEFCASIYRGCGKPVHVVGLPMPEPAALDEAERHRLIAPYLPESPGIRTVLAMYDSLSWIERKNPRLAIDVFQRAFPGRADVRFVIKTHNLERIADPAQRRTWSLVQERAAADPRIVILDQTLPAAALGALIASADVFLSLHRAEGLGLGLIEAMQRGVPVVATDYSGNRDFCRPETSWPVEFTLRPVLPGDYVYADGKAVWADPVADHAVTQLRAALDGPDRSARIAAAKAYLAEQWSLSAFAARVKPLLA